MFCLPLNSQAKGSSTESKGSRLLDGVTRRIIFLICIMALSSCATSGEGYAGYSTGLGRYNISATELTSVRRRASNGDRTAARHLMLYYTLVRYSPAEAELWRAIAERRRAVGHEAAAVGDLVGRDVPAQPRLPDPRRCPATRDDT